MGAALRLPRGSCTAQHEHRLCSPQVSLITLLMLPAILSPTIWCSTGVGLRLRPRLPVGSPFGSSLRATLQTSSLLRRLVPASDRIEFTLAPLRVTVVTDWQFLPLCSPRRVATTQLRFRSLVPFLRPRESGLSPLCIGTLSGARRDALPRVPNIPAIHLRPKTPGE